MALATVSLTVFLVMVLAVTSSSGLSDFFSNGSHTCKNHSQCALNEICVASTCMDPCTFVVCPENTTCRARNHKAICVTVVGECKTDKDCKDEESCDETEQKCVDPCVGRCGKNTICTVQQHNPNCECEPGYVGEPAIECVWPECYTHYDCAENRTCISSMCVDPCTERCGSNTDCEVHRLMPHCSCKPGYTGNPLVKCDKPECITNDNCPTNSSCVSYKCVDPCHGRCGSNAECLVHRHVPDCSCKPGYMGNPLVKCDKPECITNDNCPKNSSCVSYKCVDPCHGRCGSNAECLVHRHVPDCSCKPGYMGNPLVKCDKPECITNDNCPTNSSCVSYKCVDPCHGRCGSNAECLVHRHVPDCSCKPGYMGNPLVNCTNPIQTCVNNSQCAMDKSCVDNTCVDPCTSICCQGSTTCLTNDHEAKCVAGKREKRYIIPNDIRVDWFTAMSRCISKGMRLASVLNQEENNQLYSVIEERLRYEGKTEVYNVFWLAGSDAMEGGTWRWMTTGDTIKYTDWYDDGGNLVKEPDTREGYHFLAAGLAGVGELKRYGWINFLIKSKRPYVCEYFV